MDLYDRLKSILFNLPPEAAHDTAVKLLSWAQNPLTKPLLESQYNFEDSRLEQDLWDTTFPNPVGLAAGFDKNARIPPAVEALGFGHMEIGGVTAEGQPGNPKPRLFRLRDDKALVNRMGFNNEGAEAIADRLEAMSLPAFPVGVNMGKSKSTPLDEAAEDYAFTYKQLKDFGDYFVVNVSSPNTPGLRELQADTPLRRIIERLKELGADPLLVKVSPDLSERDLEGVVEVCAEFDLDGIIAVNTTTQRSEDLKSSARSEEGGLSGKPLAERSTQLVKFIRRRTDSPIIGVGGIFTAEDAYEKIRNGANLVQLYTGFIYEGPSVARSINEGLVSLLERDGYSRLSEAVGVDVD
ncbi:MAG: quinone-dependent dihydroorotate dehydrogenase [bacterium]